MLDCMWHYQFGLNLSTFHSDATVSLPCDISVFEAESELKWASIVSKTGEIFVLCDSVIVTLMWKRDPVPTFSSPNAICKRNY
jgi:hypothetical protein